MTKTLIYASLLLACIWIILCETLTLATMITGIVLSAGCMYVFNRFLPADEDSRVNYISLVIYPFYLIAQIYISGLSAIKMILSGADVNIVKVRTRLANGLLRTILANSITLTPGTVSLDLSGDELTVLWLVEKSDGAQNSDDADEQIKGKLERMLLKAEK